MNFKKYLPFENYVITSRLSVEEIRNRLADNIQPKRGISVFGFNRPTIKPYEGEILGDKFTMSRIINYKNSFLPVITGRISTFLNKTQIDIKMRLATVVLIFISIWLSMVGLACLGIILVASIHFKQVLQNGFSPMMLIPFGMFLFGCLLTTLAFKKESKKSKEFLNQLFEAQEDV